MSDISEVRSLLNVDGFFQWVSKEEAQRAAEIIERSNDPGGLLDQLSSNEVHRLARSLPQHEREALLNDIARDLRADAIPSNQRDTLRTSLRELVDAFGFDTVKSAFDRNATHATNVELIIAYAKSQFVDGNNVSHGTLLQITQLIEGLPRNERADVVAGLSDEELKKWASEIGAVFGNLSGEEKQHLFQILADSSDSVQFGRLASAIAAEAPEALLEFTRVARNATPEQKIAYARAVADSLPQEEIAGLQDPALVAAFIDTQNLDDRAGFERAVRAFASMSPDDIKVYAREHSTQFIRFSSSVQVHQDWYEGLTIDVIHSGQYWATTDTADVRFSREQLEAMRTAFSADDGILTNGELLLAYPDRLERNEKVTAQYLELSRGLQDLVGHEYANWATWGVWASDEVGRNLSSAQSLAIETTGLGDLRFWLSNGNTRLASDLSPVFAHFIEVYGSGDRTVTFEQFWSSLEQEYGNRGISYLDGKTDPSSVDHSGVDLKSDVKNAFKAYHEAMLLHDKTTSGQATAADDQRRGQLILYGNALVGLQEQRLIQIDLERGMKLAGITNPAGQLHYFLDMHIPDRELHLDLDLPADVPGIMDLDASFTKVDGTTVVLRDDLQNRLNGLDGDRSPQDENEWLRAETGVDHWEHYDQRMGWIFHFFAGYHMDNRVRTNDPREVWGARAENLDTQPEPFIRMG